MKKAILLSGFMKSFYKMIEHFYENVFDEDTDLFIYYVPNSVYNCDHIHFDDDENNIEKMLYNKFGNNIKILQCRKNEEKMERDKIYEEKKILVGDFKYKSNFYDLEKKKLSRKVVDQFYNLHKLTELFINYVNENDIKYDIVVKGRFDRLLYINKLDLSNYENINNEFLSIDGIEKKWVSDSFFFGSQKTMEYVCYNFINKLYEYIGNEYNESKEYEHTTVLAPEKQLYFYLKDICENNFEILDFKINFILINTNKCRFCAYYETVFI